MNSTKKLPVAISFGEFKTRSTEFLIPLKRAGENSFIGIKTGVAYPFGAISYLGKAITADDILDKLRANGVQLPGELDARGLLENFVMALTSFKIGNIVKVESVEGSRV